MNVVLPAPFGPIRPMICPCSSVRWTPSTARTPSKWTWISSATNFAGPEPSTAVISSQLLDFDSRYLTFTGTPEHGLPSPMLGIDLTAWVPICLSLPFVHCSIE